MKKSFTFSYSVVCGIIFWTVVFIIVSLCRLASILIKWVPTKFDPEIEAVSHNKIFSEKNRSHFFKICTKRVREISTTTWEAINVSYQI